MIILDTNVLSALMLDEPDETVMAWLDRQPARSVWTTVITIFEIQLGISLLPDSHRRRRIEGRFSTLRHEYLDRRVLPVDDVAAELAGTLSASRQKKGIVIDVGDTLIAGIALAVGATVATRNVRHFPDLNGRVVNPWRRNPADL